MNYPDDNPKTIMGLAKAPFRAIPPTALVWLGKAMMDGLKKYGIMNWREKPVTASTYYDAALRHLFSYWDGEQYASDSKVHHLGHVMACCAIIIDAEEQGTLNDDRGMAGKFAAMVDRLKEGGTVNMFQVPAEAFGTKTLVKEDYMTRNLDAEARSMP